MGAVATDEKQALAEELVEARALVEQGEYEAALDKLASVRKRAGRWRDSEALRGVLAVLGVLERRARREAGIVERTEALGLRVRRDLGLDMHRRRVGFGFVWALVVVAVWLALCVVTALVVEDSQGEFGWSDRSLAVAVVVMVGGMIAFVVWLVGVLVHSARSQGERRP